MGDRNQLQSAPDSFEALDAWKVARELAAEIYALCRREPLCRDYGLGDQRRRSAVPAMNNIAEGWERLHVAEKGQSYGYARRSCGEVRSMTYVLLDNPFINPDEQTALLNPCVRSGKLFSGPIRSLYQRQ